MRIGRPLAVAISALLLLGGCGYPASLSTRDHDYSARPLATSDHARRTLSSGRLETKVPASLGATEAALALLPRHAAAMGRFDASASNSDYQIEARRVGAPVFARRLVVERVIPVYSLPSTGSVTFASLASTGSYVVVLGHKPGTRPRVVHPGNEEEPVSTFFVYRDAAKGAWRYSSGELSTGQYMFMQRQLKKFTKGETFDARFVYPGGISWWWLVRFADGRESAIAYFGGNPLDSPPSGPYRTSDLRRLSFR